MVSILSSKPTAITTLLGWMVAILPIPIAEAAVRVFSGNNVFADAVTLVTLAIGFYSISLMLIGPIDPKYRTIVFRSVIVTFVFCRTFPVFVFFPSWKVTQSKIMVFRKRMVELEAAEANATKPLDS